MNNYFKDAIDLSVIKSGQKLKDVKKRIIKSVFKNAKSDISASNRMSGLYNGNRRMIEPHDVVLICDELKITPNEFFEYDKECDENHNTHARLNGYFFCPICGKDIR